MPYYVIDPMIGPFIKVKLKGSQETLPLWHLPVTAPPPGLQIFGTQTDPSNLSNRLLGTWMPGALAVLAPLAGARSVKDGNVWLQTPRMGLDLVHTFEGFNQYLPGAQVQERQAIGTTDKGLRWFVRVKLDQEDGAVLERWNQVLFKSPGHPRVRNFIGQWLLDRKNEDWLNLLGTLERGGGLEPNQALLVQVGEKGEAASRAVTSTLKDSADTLRSTATNTVRYGVNTLTELGQELEPLAPEGGFSPWLLGGLAVLGIGGFIVWRVTK